MTAMPADDTPRAIDDHAALRAVVESTSGETGKAFFQLQTRLTTELVAVRTGIDQMVSAFREYRDEDRVLLQAHDVAIGDLRTRVDRLERRAREPERG